MEKIPVSCFCHLFDDVSMNVLLASVSDDDCDNDCHDDQKRRSVIMNGWEKNIFFSLKTMMMIVILILCNLFVTWMMWCHVWFDTSCVTINLSIIITIIIYGKEEKIIKMKETSHSSSAAADNKHMRQGEHKEKRDNGF